ncbi:hypothetical protein ACFWRX_16985 [Streptomyces albidoflavus]
MTGGAPGAPARCHSPEVVGDESFQPVPSSTRRRLVAAALGGAWWMLRRGAAARE